MTASGVDWSAPGPTLLVASILLLISLTSTAGASESIAQDAMDCLIEPWVVSDVGSPVQGVIAKLLVDRGERVSRGQPLAQLESSVESAEVALAQTSAETESEIDVREADLTLAKLERDRLEDLYQQKIISAQQRDEATARYRIARATLKQAQENRRIQQLELRRSERLYARRILTSPVDGVVVAQLAFAGEFVYDNPVMTIAALDPLRVEVMLPARLFGTIAVGDIAQLYPELGGDAALPATVDVVDAMLDSRSGTFGVRLKVPNPDHRIPAGQRCRIVFEPVVAAANSDDRSAQTDPAEQ
ncbi:efflux RND transporter periplasmic adaptor subunit [Granulosicoccus sp. 3-233]|uniref:efflux RND transporter periplasmic adaptor subunit n=1 Tax=Granulosicoccus sp. 3-233 TaxID=3417969 RepID=UPI003D329038